MTATPTPGEIANASADLSGGFASASEMVEMIVIVVSLSAVILALVGLRGSETRYRYVVYAADYLLTLLAYAVKGVITVAVAAVVIAPVYLVATADPATQRQVGRYAVLAVVGVLALAGVGYAGEWLWEGLADRHEAVTGHRPFEREEIDDNEEVAD